MPGPADAGYKEHPVADLLPVEREAVPWKTAANEVTVIKGFLGFSRRLNVEPVLVMPIIGAVNREMGVFASLTERVEVKIGLLGSYAPNVSEG
jgi:hypothetical protein